MRAGGAPQLGKGDRRARTAQFPGTSAEQLEYLLKTEVAQAKLGQPSIELSVLLEDEGCRVREIGSGMSQPLFNAGSQELSRWNSRRLRELFELDRAVVRESESDGHHGGEYTTPFAFWLLSSGPPTETSGSPPAGVETRGGISAAETSRPSLACEG